MIRQDDDRRYKMAFLNPYQIVNLFMDWSSPSSCFSQARLHGVPEDYVIDDIRYVETVAAFQILIYHPTFPLVKVGDLPPQIACTCEGFYLPKCNSMLEAINWNNDRQSLADLVDSMAGVK